MTYPSLMSDEQDDWERQRREAEQLAMLLPDDERMPSPMQLPPPHDSLEMPPVQVDNGPDWTDALGVGTTALASLVDLAANHGRGVGQILSSGGAYGAARAGQRLQQTQDALSYEQKRAELAQKNKYDDYLYASMAQRGQNQATSHADRQVSQGQRQQDLDRKQTTDERAGAKADRESNPESEYAATFGGWLVDRGFAKPGELNGMSYEQMKAAKPELAQAWEFDHAGPKAAAQAAGRIGAENALAGETGEAEAAKYAAQTPGAVDRAKQIGEGKEEVSGAIGRAEEAQRQARFNKFRDETEKTRPQVGIAANLDKTLAKYPSDKPGVGVWDSYKSGKLASDDDLAVRGAVTNMTDLVARVRSGAAIPPKEFENISRFVDGGEGASEQQFRVAYNAYKRTLQDEMKQQSRGREGEARDVLGEYGDWALGPKPRPAARAPAISQNGGMGQPPKTRVSTQQPTAKPNADGSFDVDGETYTAAEVQKLRAMGAIQ